MIVFLFGGGKPSVYVISKSLYDQQKEMNMVYKLKQRLSPKGDETLYTTFKTSEPFLMDMPLPKKDKEGAVKLGKQLAIPPDQAEEILLAKRAGCPLALSQKQVWLAAAAEKAGVKVEIFK